MACTLRIINGVSSQGVVIKEAGAVFHKKIGGTENNGPRIVNLTNGQHADFEYNGSECIDEIFGAIEITIPNKPNKNLQFTKKPATAGACMPPLVDAVLTIGSSAISPTELSIDTSITVIVDKKPEKFISKS